MANFDINFNDINKNISEIESNIKEYKDIIKNLKDNLNNIDSAWNDLNTENFIKIVKTEYNLFSDQITAMDKYLNSINSFINSLSSEIKSKINVQVLQKVSYNSDYMNKQIEYLRNVFLHLNYCVNLLENLDLPITFEYKTTIESYYRQLKSNRDTINNLRSKLESINTSILTLINMTRDNVNSIDFVTINRNEMQYNWKIYSADLIDTNMASKGNSYNFNDKETLFLNNNISSDINDVSIEQNKRAQSNNLVLQDLINSNADQIQIIERNANQNNKNDILSEQNLDNVKIEKKEYNNNIENKSTLLSNVEEQEIYRPLQNKNINSLDSKVVSDVSVDKYKSNSNINFNELEKNDVNSIFEKSEVVNNISNSNLNDINFDI